MDRPRRLGAAAVRGRYFYAQAHSLAFHYTDDIELKLDNDKREVQFRSSTRLGQADWDVERLRYNQFARMLNKYGGWQVQELPRLNWYASTPFRWTQLTLDKAANSAERLANTLSTRIPSAGRGGSSDGAARQVLEELRSFVTTLLQPLLDEAGKVKDSIILEPRVAAALQALSDFEAKVVGSVEVTTQQARDAAEKVLRLLPERFLEEPPSNRGAQNMLEVPDPAVVEGHPPISAEEPQVMLGILLRRGVRIRPPAKRSRRVPTQPARISSRTLWNRRGSLHRDQRQSRSSGPTVGEQRVLQARFRELKKLVNK